MTVALLEIDFQPWILAMAHDPSVVERAVATRRRFPEATVFTLRYRSMDAGDPMRFDLTGPGARFLPELAPEPDSVVLSKTGKDPFENPDLEANLRCRGVETVVVYGLLSDGGVKEAARTAHRLGFRVSVVAEACAGSSATAHEAAMSELRSCVAVD